MNQMTPPPRLEIIPANAPFTEGQRSWLNGFLVGMLSLDGAVPPLAPGAGGATLVPAGDADDGEAPWHDQTMPIADRMKLADGRPLRRRMMAAMAQQDCGQCGYNCNDYSAAIAGKAELRLNLCVPGGKETARMLKALNEELENAPPASPGSAAPSAVTAPVTVMAEPGRSRDNPTLISAAAVWIMSSAIPSAFSPATRSAWSIRSSPCSALPIPPMSTARPCATP
jgi:sulfite reductase (NADPH) flavoprotein alpha-component